MQLPMFWMAAYNIWQKLHKDTPTQKKKKRKNNKQIYTYILIDVDYFFRF